MNRLVTEYCQELLKEQNKAKTLKNKMSLKKGRSALEFYFMLDNGYKLSISRWATRWEVSKSTSSMWVREFKEIYKQSMGL